MKKNKKVGKVNLADDIYLERNNITDGSKKGYNFVENMCNWTSIEEQKLKVKEIENKLKDS